jgi:precorrin isomerase
MVDIGFVSAKDVTQYLAEKYIPDLEIKGRGGTLIQIKSNTVPST